MADSNGKSFVVGYRPPATSHQFCMFKVCW
jgi:hypothetical protein